MTRRCPARAGARDLSARSSPAHGQSSTPIPKPIPRAAEATGGGGGARTSPRACARSTKTPPCRSRDRAVAGVTERTHLQICAEGRLETALCLDRPRRRARRGAQCAPRAPAPGARHDDRAGQFTPVKGAGGRFIARADKGKPFARGLKATDRQGAARASAACVRAEAIAAQAQATRRGARGTETRVLVAASPPRAARPARRAIARCAPNGGRSGMRDGDAAHACEQSLEQASGTSRSTVWRSARRRCIRRCDGS